MTIIRIPEKEAYNKIFNSNISQDLYREHKPQPTGKAEKDSETAAQKEAVKQSIIQGLENFSQADAADIWKAIYEIHVHHKSGIDDSEIISKVVSADQSWKKSSGHAFEEMVKQLASLALEESGIEIILQRDLNTLIKADEIDNEPRDISWLKEQIAGDVFDLYAVVAKGDKRYCFGCLQCKTSVRDRVTRDREPSLRAMQSYFWSVAIVLDGDFLKLPKFKEMVNGGGINQKVNGWHSMYIFTNEESEGRIYHTNIDFDIFKRHAMEAANMWLTQRQWFNEDWEPTKNERNHTFKDRTATKND